MGLLGIQTSEQDMGWGGAGKGLAGVGEEGWGLPLEPGKPWFLLAP